MVKAVVGANWGDEGKGKITDMLAEKADIIIRFQGGANAGHTIINDYGKFALMDILQVLSEMVLQSIFRCCSMRFSPSSTEECRCRRFWFLTEHRW